jgi:hypothetical protein
MGSSGVCHQPGEEEGRDDVALAAEERPVAGRHVVLLQHPVQPAHQPLPVEHLLEARTSQPAPRVSQWGLRVASDIVGSAPPWRVWRWRGRRAGGRWRTRSAPDPDNTPRHARATGQAT